MMRVAPGFRHGPRVVTRAQTRGDQDVLLILSVAFKMRRYDMALNGAGQICVGDTGGAVHQSNNITHIDTVISHIDTVI